MHGVIKDCIQSCRDLLKSLKELALILWPFYLGIQITRLCYLTFFAHRTKWPCDWSHKKKPRVCADIGWPDVLMRTQ